MGAVRFFGEEVAGAAVGSGAAALANGPVFADAAFALQLRQIAEASLTADIPWPLFLSFQ